MKYMLLIFVSVFLASCDCMYEARGFVVDEQGEPLDSVVSYMEGRTPFDYNMSRDTLGKFEVSAITGFDCGCKGIVFARRGYDTLRVDIDNQDTVVVKMKKVK
jgi:hypothetical protein